MNSWMKVTEIIKLLKIGRTHMTRLLSEGALPYELDPADKRVKLVKRRDVEHLFKFRLENSNVEQREI